MTQTPFRAPQVARPVAPEHSRVHTPLGNPPPRPATSTVDLRQIRPAPHSESALQGVLSAVAPPSGMTTVMPVSWEVDASDVMTLPGHATGSPTKLLVAAPPLHVRPTVAQKAEHLEVSPPAGFTVRDAVARRRVGVSFDRAYRRSSLWRRPSRRRCCCCCYTPLPARSRPPRTSFLRRAIASWTFEVSVERGSRKPNSARP